ncbi:MAG: type II secretion system F family protein [Fusobacteriaceae bacterium]|nr:type II secretion system F family protein [Fusobacteriaceae bacterium]
MSIYNYTAFDTKGKQKHGKKEAIDINDLKKILRSENLILLNGKLEKHIFLFKQKIDKRKILFFTREVKIMLESGIDIIRVLAIEEEEIENLKFKEIIRDIKNEILSGKSIGDSFKKHENIFDETYINYLKIGESSGTLTENIDRICQYIEIDLELSAKIKEAMFYPTIIFIFSILVIFFLVGFVLPNFVEMFIDSGTELPLLTRVLLFFSDHILKIFMILLSVILCLRYLRQQIFKNPEKKYEYQRKIFNIIIFGNIFKKNIISKLSKNFALLLNSGMVITSVIENISNNIDNVYIEKKLYKMKILILSGNEIGNSITELGIFPKNYITMIKIGEESGKLVEIFEKISEISQEEMEREIKRMLIFIEPLMIMILGIAIGIVVVAIYLPIFSMSDLIG